MIVHSGLWSELSLFYIYQDRKYKFEIGQVVNCRVKGWNKSFVLVDIFDSDVEGSIHISKLNKERKYVRSIDSVIKHGEVLKS